jgi:3-deoxy-manno-octulosonate cytidylyltransferase (CMP-KDO synthetase)
MSAVVLIPARLAATRLPGKPLADIGGEPMIVRVLRQAEKAGVGPVVVAAGDAEIVEAVRRTGGEAVLTDADLPSGSDRVLAALQALEACEADVVLNVQGDMPFIDPAAIVACAALLAEEPDCDIATTVAEAKTEAERRDPDVVKAILALRGAARGRALYFTRATPYGEGPVWHHFGVYGYRRAALERFCAAPPSPLETREKLEQLRALEMGLSIWAAVLPEAPISVDNPEDLAAARAYAEAHP